MWPESSPWGRALRRCSCRGKRGAIEQLELRVAVPLYRLEQRADVDPGVDGLADHGSACDPRGAIESVFHVFERGRLLDWSAASEPRGFEATDGLVCGDVPLLEPWRAEELSERALRRLPSTRGGGFV